ncbi:MAG: NUDIX hydrolase [Actinobacteria bacterium]|nr:NUDIX hydrolase [Actinomycetota bacterium]MDI6829791.1 NUDIX hydrolase [Actinomycetota bacterium]
MKEAREETLERRTVFEGKVVRLYLDRVLLPDGREAEREVVLHRGAVGMVALDGEGHVFLVRQYRHAPGEHLVEIPAGKLDAGEDPLECARRELQEEVGCAAESWHLLASFYTSPGFSDEVLHLYLARGLTRGEAAPDEDEFLEVMRVPLEDALAMVARGEIRDSKTVAGIALASLYLAGSYPPGGEGDEGGEGA